MSNKAKVGAPKPRATSRTKQGARQGMRAAPAPALKYRFAIGDREIARRGVGTVREARATARKLAKERGEAVSIVRRDRQFVAAFEPSGAEVRDSCIVRVAGRTLSGTFDIEEAKQTALSLAKGKVAVELCNVWGDTLAVVRKRA